MTKYKVVRSPDSYAIYKCKLWTIHDENGIWVGKYHKEIWPCYATKKDATDSLNKLIKKLKK